MSAGPSGTNHESLTAVASPIAPWQRASQSDLIGLDFEAPIAHCDAADCHQLSKLFETARQQTEQESNETPASRVFSLLAAITNFHFKPNDKGEPFGPLWQSSEGRSAIPEDFRGALLEVVTGLADCATNVVLRARLCDVVWLLNRKSAHHAAIAINSYIAILRGVDTGTLAFTQDVENGILTQSGRDLLRRALQIGRVIGWEKPETVAARDLALELRKRATSHTHSTPALWFSELDLDFGVSKPQEVAAGIESVLNRLATDRSQPSVELWRLAARAYHFAKTDEDKYRCQSAAAEILVSEAERQTGSAMLAAHWLSQAISEFHGIPNKKDRRTELRHRLIDVQARVPDEMSLFSRTTDLTEIVEHTENALIGKGLLDKLLIFAGLAQSPNPEELRKAAVESVQRFPLASLFAASHHDHEGKVIHRTEGGGTGDFEPAIIRQIAQNEDIRRSLIAGGNIEPARAVIVTEHYMSDDTFRSLLRYSPFVPPDLLRTFSRGFARYFQGDQVSALYILTPLLEDSLRHVLKSHGHDVTIFDDATQVQEDRTLSSLFEQMRPALDAVFGNAITADIENVFLRRPGPCLRHSVAHGLLRDGSAYGSDAIYACWLIFRLCCLPLILHRDKMQIIGD